MSELMPELENILRDYSVPLPDIRKRYRYEAGNKGWGATPVRVFRVEENKKDVLVAEYERNYSMLRTFEPFAQKQGSSWHDYALISHDYTSLAVLDLESGEIIAEELEGEVTAEMAAENPALAVGKPLSPGFCPADFFVPNWWDQYDESQTAEWMREEAAAGENGLRFVLDELKEMTMFVGQWGLYSGCFWGDDSYWKLRYVDLSRISEGVVTTDDRFGYFQLPQTGKLSDHVQLYPSMNRVEISTPVMFDLDTNKAVGRGITVDSINWG